MVLSFAQACKDSPATTDSTAGDQERDRAVEQRLIPYFQNDVTARLRQCWGQVTGTGALAVALHYTKSDRRWAWQELSVTGSTLSGDQETAASKCLQDAVRGTSFPEDAHDVEFKSSTPAARLLVNWSVPVPLPSDAVAVLAKAPASGGGGTDSPSSCWVCGVDRNNEQVCEGKKTGYAGCIERDLGGVRLLRWNLCIRRFCEAG